MIKNLQHLNNLSATVTTLASRDQCLSENCTKGTIATASHEATRKTVTVPTTPKTVTSKTNHKNNVTTIANTHLIRNTTANDKRQMLYSSYEKYNDRHTQNTKQQQ